MPQKDEDLSPLQTTLENVSIRPYVDSLTELLAPCGRFRSPDPLSTRASWMAARLLSQLRLLERRDVESSTVPLNWQRIAIYLHASGVTTEPFFRSPPIRKGAEHLEQFFLTLNRTKRITDGSIPQFDTGFGASLLKADALSKTIGESLERFFLSTYRLESLKKASMSDLERNKQTILNIASLNSYLPWQQDRFPEFRHNQLSEFRFVECRSYPDQTPVLVPAQLVFWNYKHDTEIREPVLARATTSGSAGQFTKEEAILAALLELIQRDGFFIWWLNSLAPSVLDVALLNDTALNTLIREQNEKGIMLTFLNTSTDIKVPCITCVAVQTTGDDAPVISVGSAAGFNLHELLMHSAVEAVQVNSYAAANKMYVVDDREPFTDSSMQREARLCAWKGKQMASHFSFFMQGEKIDPRSLLRGLENLTDTASQLRHLLNCFDSLGEGYEVYVYEAHDSVLDRLGYHVVRVIVPQLFPLYLSEYAAPLLSSRLQSVPRALGKKAAQKPNPWPHPFP